MSGMRYLVMCASLAVCVSCRSTHGGQVHRSESKMQEALQELLDDLKTEGSHCGQPLASTARIVGGQQSDPNQWPWMLRYNLDGKIYCGASILSRNWALTAAHCLYEDSAGAGGAPYNYVYGGDGGGNQYFYYGNNEDNNNNNWSDDWYPYSYFYWYWYPLRSRGNGMRRITDPSRLSVTAADHDIQQTEGQEQTVQVQVIYEHPSFDLETVDNDIALLKLATPLTFNDKVRQVCLPRTDPPQNSHCVAAGWGVTNDASISSATLNHVTLPLYSRPACAAVIDGLTENQFCAGRPTGGIDTCQGDSGGPLVCLVNGYWVQVGLTSFGDGCAEPNSPGVYTRLSRYQTWLGQTTRNAAEFS